MPSSFVICRADYEEIAHRRGHWTACYKFEMEAPGILALLAQQAGVGAQGFSIWLSLIYLMEVVISFLPKHFKTRFPGYEVTVMVSTCYYWMIKDFHIFRFSPDFYSCTLQSLAGFDLIWVNVFSVHKLQYQSNQQLFSVASSVRWEAPIEQVRARHVFRQRDAWN